MKLIFYALVCVALIVAAVFLWFSGNPVAALVVGAVGAVPLIAIVILLISMNRSGYGPG